MSPHAPSAPDVDGIYDRPPKEEGASFLTYFNPKNIDTLQFGEKSTVGTGGMESKVITILTYDWSSTARD